MRFIYLVFFLLPLLTTVNSQAARPNGQDDENLDPVQPGQPNFEKRKQILCNPHFRSIDGTCTNPRHKLWAAVSRPHYSYFTTFSSLTPTGQHLPSARYLSNVLCRQTDDLLNKRGLTELVTFFGQFLDHNIVATPVTPRDSMNIPVPHNDPVFANFSGELPFERSVRGKVGRFKKHERPINTLSSAIDLAAIYGSDDLRTRALRSFKDGKLQTSQRDLLQVNTDRLRNAPTPSSSFYVSGDHRANEHPVLTAFHTLFVREHNRLCDELKKGFPDWNDESLFHVARKINGALFQKIVYTEFIPAMTGRRLRRYRGFRSYVNPTVSDIFSTAAFRVGHTMVGNKINRRDRDMKPMSSFAMQDMFFRTRDVMKQGIEPFIRGAIYHRAQEIDLHVHDSLRNFLFTGIPQEKGFDLVSLNIQRGRDHALPTFNEIRKLFRLRPVKRFREITQKRSIQSALATAYGSPDRVEAWAGMVAEDHVRGGSMGETMMTVWGAEFTRLRDGDKFFYKGWNQFPYIIYRRMPHLRRMMFGSETMREIILRNSEITEEEIGFTVWRERSFLEEMQKRSRKRYGSGRGFGRRLRFRRLRFRKQRRKFATL